MPEGTPAKKRSCLKTSCLACGGLLLLGAVGLVGWSAVASRSLDQRVALLNTELAAARASRPIERAPTLRPGEAATDGDAVDDYAVLTWVLKPAEAQPAPPSAGATGLERDHPGFSGVPFALTPPGKVSIEAMLETNQEPTAAMAKTLALYGPLARHVRDGVRRTRCDWDPDLSAGSLVEIPDLLVLRSVAYYMAFEAAGQTPLESARTGLAIVAFGRDVHRHGTLIAAAIGCVIQEVGLRTVARAVDHGGASKAGLLELRDALAGLAPLTIDRALLVERLGMQVELARLASHPLAPPAPPGAAPPGVAPLGGASRLGPIFFDRELAGYTRLMAELAAVLKLPAPEREAAAQAALDGVQTYLVARIATPNLPAMQAHLDRVNVSAALVQLLVTAQLKRAESGQLPADLGPLPADPFAASGTPVRVTIEGPLVRAWSVGEDLVDGGGAPGEKSSEGDVVFATHLLP